VTTGRAHDLSLIYSRLNDRFFASRLRVLYLDRHVLITIILGYKEFLSDELNRFECLLGETNARDGGNILSNLANETNERRAGN
jgi:hypothetical protein